MNTILSLILIISPISIIYCQLESIEIEELKSDLFSTPDTINFSNLPIYADPYSYDFEDFKNDKFSFQIDSIKIKKIEKYKKELEDQILERITGCNNYISYSWVYLATFLKYKSAVPILKDRLISCDRVYGYEGMDYSLIESYLNSSQFFFFQAYIAAIEYITNEPFHLAFTNEERDELKKQSERLEYYHKNRKDICFENKDFLKACAAYWLLNELNNTNVKE